MKKSRIEVLFVVLFTASLVIAMAGCAPSKRVTIAGDHWGVDVTLDDEKRLETVYIEGLPNAVDVSTGTTPEGAKFINIKKR